MNKRVRRLILQVFSSLNVFFLAFQPLAALPVLMANPVVVQAETTVSADAVDLSFNASNHEFQLRVKTDQALPYVLTYFDEKQDPQVEQAAQGDLEKMAEGVFGADIYAGTCSGEACTPITFIRGTLIVGDNFNRSFQLVNGAIVFDGPSSFVEQTCVNPDENDLSAGETLWTVDEATGVAETKTKVQPGVSYQFPLDDTVSVTFSCLPKDESLRSSLKIQQVLVSELNLPDSVKTSATYAYDITTKMENGTFTYELTLPKAVGVEADVVYIEKSLEEVKTSVLVDDVITVEETEDVKVEQKLDSDEIKLSGLEHFSIYLTTGVSLTVSSNNVTNPNFAWTSNDAYAVFSTNNGEATYQFDNLPTLGAGDTIDGIEVLLEGYQESTGGSTGTFLIRLYHHTSGGNTSPISFPAFSSSPDNIITLGGPTEKWGKSWSYQDFQGDNFKARLLAAISGEHKLYLDRIIVKIYYTPAPVCTQDQQGANDEPGQKDLTLMCHQSANLPQKLEVEWNWDDTSWPGNNTGDACSLYDTDSNGNANYALCVTVGGNPASLSNQRLFSCDDGSNNKCSGPTNITPGAFGPCLASVENSDPFHSGDAYPNDTHAWCNIWLSQYGLPATLQLIDVCSYPSQQPNSDPSDCILASTGNSPTATPTPTPTATSTPSPSPTATPSPTNTPSPTPTNTPTPTATPTPTMPSERCGDGVVNQDNEQCDYGSLNGQSSCSSECTWVNECRQEMVANGGFETPVVSQGAGWDAFDNTQMAGWTAEWYGGSATYNGHDRPEPQIEMHRGVNGWLPPAGSQQYVELDTDWTGPVNDFSGEPASIALSQDIPTIVGNEYTVSWKYSPRPNYASNQLSVSVGGSEVWNSTVIAGGSQTNWQTESYTFTATSTLAKVTFSEVGPADSLGMFLDDVTISCTEPSPSPSPTATPTPSPTPVACSEGTTWANVVVNSQQGTLKNGSPVTDPARTNPTRALGATDGQFFSLGYGGTLIVSFAGYIVDVPNSPDLSFHEVTNGRPSYPVEKVNVSVSQDGSNWTQLGEVTNKDGGNGVGYLDLAGSGLAWIKYVQITDTTDDQALPATADGYDLDAVDATQQVCEEPVPPVTLYAHKVICNSESDLPNWGDDAGGQVTATTAQDYVDQSRGRCKLAEDWDFEWGYDGSAPKQSGEYVGYAGAPWTEFNVKTFEASPAAAIIPNPDGKTLWFREVLQEGYIPFTYPPDASPGSNVSAEFYCNNDHYKYDNYESISNAKPGDTYYCVAFNAPTTKDVEICKVDDQDKAQPGWTVGLAKQTPEFSDVIPVTSGTGVDASLPAGDHVVFASGTYRYGSSAMIADAGFSYRPLSIPMGADGWVSGDQLTTVGGLELKVGGQNIAWGGYNPTHQYTTLVSGFAGGNLNLNIWDNQYSDNLNNGNFRAQVHQIVTTGVTEDDGCVTLEDVPYGDYVAFELPQDNWSHVSTMVNGQNTDTFPAPITVGGRDSSVTFENRLVTGQIRVQKTTDPAGDPTTFNVTAAGGGQIFGSATGSVTDTADYTYTVEPQTYSVSEDVPNGWELTSNNCGNLLVPSDGERVCEISNQKLGAIQGRKYQDSNLDGTRQSGEPWLGGWTINLYSSDWQLLDSETTINSSGLYRFENLNKGTYFTCEVMQPDWKQTGPKDINANQVENLSPNKADEGAVCWRSIINQSGQERTGRQFGNAPVYDIHGYKWNDVDRNAINNQEEMLPGWEIFIDQNDNQSWDADEPKTTTSSDPNHLGWYWFENLYAGTYEVCEILQDGWAQTYPVDPNCHTVTLPDQNLRQMVVSDNMVSGPEYNFGNTQYGDASVYKYEDLNTNGKYDVGEPLLAGWNMSLADSSGVSSTQTTGTGGNTVFDVLGGTYYLSEEMQGGWYQSAISCDSNLGGVMITQPNYAYGHHGNCSGWNTCGNAETCALKACQANGYSSLVSYGDAKPCTEFENCSLFYNIDRDLSYQADWGNWCPVMGVTDIVCANSSQPTVSPSPSPSVTPSVTPSPTPGECSDIDGDEVCDVSDNCPSIANAGQQDSDGNAIGDACEAVDASSWLDKILGVTKAMAQEVASVIRPNSKSVVVEAGKTTTCYIGNYQPGSIQGTKYFDANKNGNFDDGDSKMQYWGISLSGNGMTEQKVTTDENGGFSFTNLKKGTYTLCEEDRTSWGWQVTEPAEPINTVCREVVIDQSGETEVANFGNFIESRLYILKTNNAWPTDVTIGDEVTYTIRVMAVGGPVYDATVLDVPPAQLTYVPDSYTAESSDGTDLRADGTTGDPNYQSPGKWTLGDLDKDEIVTLTYKAKVGTLADPGVYPDMVWATGTSEQSRATGGDTDDLLALSDPEFDAESGEVTFDGALGHFGEDNFAGTQVAVVLDQTPFSEFQVGKTEEKQGAVLGASTELPATGARAWLTLLALISMVAGAGFLLFNRRGTKSGLKVFAGLLTVGVSLWFAQPAQALTSVRVEEPYNTSAEFTLDAITNQTTMKVDFVVLNTDNLSVTAQCQQQKNDGAWSNVTTNYTIKAGGNSGYCEAKDLENTQNYDFRVVVSGDGPDKISDEVRVGLDTTHPDKPVNYSKNPGNYCEDKIGFKTANDGQTTSVEVYRSTDNDHFTAKPDTRVTTIPIGPNQEYTLTTSKPNCDDTYYYVIRAFDVNGNASDLVGDQEIKTVIIQTSSGTTQTIQLGAIPAGSSFIGGDTSDGSATGGTTEEATETIEGESASETTTAEPTATESTGAVLGSATETFMSFLSRFGLPIGVGLIVLAGLYIIFFGKRNEK